MDYEIGKRYAISKQTERELINGLGLFAMVMGKIDLSRGRLFVKPPADWELWNTEGKKIKISFVPSQHLIGSCSKDVDPNLPEPL